MLTSKTYSSLHEAVKDKAITPKALDSFVQGLTEYSFLQSYAWQKFMQENFGRRFKLTVLFDGNKPVGFVPFTVVYAKRGNILSVRHGPIIDWHNQKLVQFALKTLYDLGKEHNMWMARFQPYVELAEWQKLFVFISKQTNFKIKLSTLHERDFERTLVLDLTQPYEKIFKSFRKTHKKKIRRAKRMGLKVKVVEEYNKDIFDAFLDILYQTVEKKGWFESSRRYYHNQFKTLSKYGMSKLFLVYKNDVLVHGSVHEFYGKRVLAHYAGFNFKFRHLPVAYILKDFVFQFAKERGFTYYDFGGIGPEDNPRHPLYGVTRYKLGYRGQLKRYASTYDIILKPFAYATRMYELIQNYRRGWFTKEEMVERI